MSSSQSDWQEMEARARLARGRCPYWDAGWCYGTIGGKDGACVGHEKCAVYRNMRENLKKTETGLDIPQSGDYS